MKIIINKLNKINKINQILPYLLFTILISQSLVNSLTLKSNSQFNTNANLNMNLKMNMNTLNMSMQKALLSTEDFQISKIFPKQHKISTEGIFFDEKNSQIYETGAMKNINIILKKSYPGNKVQKALPLGAYNVKGLAKCGNFMYQFSGIQNKILKFSYPNLDLLNMVNIDYELQNGQGLAELSEDFLIASNGTDMIYVLDCKNDLSIIKSFSVKNFEEEPLLGIKDMVVVGEYIYANKENDNRIIKISPATGKVLKFYNLTNLVNFELKTKSLTANEVNKGANLNGIAYDKSKKMFILTGKNWGHYYEVDLK